MITNQVLTVRSNLLIIMIAGAYFYVCPHISFKFQKSRSYSSYVCVTCFFYSFNCGVNIKTEKKLSVKHTTQRFYFFTRHSNYLLYRTLSITLTDHYMYLIFSQIILIRPFRCKRNTFMKYYVVCRNRSYQ